MNHLNQKTMENYVQKRYIIVKAYLLKELAAIYDVDTRTLKKWMKPYEQEIGLRIGYYFRPGQVKVIFKNIPLPENVVLIDGNDNAKASA